MCQSVPNRRGRAAAAAVLASATADGGVKGASQPSIAVAEEEKQPFSSSLASTTNKPQTLTGDPSQRQPTALPPFTIGTLRKAIPPHCFERSLLRSSLSLALDLSLAAVLAVAAAAGIPRMVPASCAYSPLLRGLAWLAYWWFQGAICTGIWVQAHECGHQAFSPSQSVNDAVGLVLHSLLLVPYFSWKHSHRRHHSNTGSVDRDEVFVPPVRKAKSDDCEKKKTGASGGTGGNFSHALGEQLLASAPGRLGAIGFALTLGWPAYLLFNASGRPTFPKGAWPNHFAPSSPIFTSKREKVEVAVSDAALAVVAVGLFFLGKNFGFDTLFYLYFVPYLVVNAWLVTITLLQHTHPALPHYYTESWDWLRGALSTVDRDYGWFLNRAHHHIADTHVLHHLFSQIPHYHAQEATEAIKPILGPYYARDAGRGILKSIWEDLRECAVVTADAREEREEGRRAPLWFRRLVE